MIDRADRVLLNALAKLASDDEMGLTTFSQHRFSDIMIGTCLAVRLYRPLKMYSVSAVASLETPPSVLESS